MTFENWYYLCGERNAIAGNTWWRNTPYGFYAIERSIMTLKVYRRLDNRREGLSDDSERSIELHNRRKKALHSVLENEESWRVINWGQTDDETPHELVTLTLLVGEILADEIIVGALAGAVATKAIDVLFNVLVKAITRISRNIVATAKIIIYRLLQKQREQEIEDYLIILKDISIWCRLEGETLVITLEDRQSGETHTVSYDLAEDKMISQENIVRIHIKPVDKEKSIISFVKAKRLRDNSYKIVSENSPYALGDTVKCIARVPIQELEKGIPNEDKKTILLVRNAG